jgi:hypothetical protein
MCKKSLASRQRARADDPGRLPVEIQPKQKTRNASTSMKSASMFAVALIGSSLTLARPGVAADAPTVDSILAKFVEALGGKAAFEKVHSRVVQFRLESQSLGDCEGEALAKAPDRQRSHIDLGGPGVIDEGFDGTVAWVKNPWEGLRVKTGDELAKVKRDAQFNRELKLKSLHPDLAYKGKEKVGDEEAWLLESKPTASSKESWWFSTKSGLLLRQDSQYEGPNGTLNVSALPQDYKAFEGLKVPGSMRVEVLGGGQKLEFALKFLGVKYNVEIDAAKFAKPAE